MARVTTNLLAAGLIALAACAASPAGSTPDAGQPDAGDTALLAPGTVVPTVDRPQAVVTADFDSDGKLDLAVGGGLGAVDVLHGDGTGGFTSLHRYQDASSSAIYSALVAGPFDADAHLDLAALDYNSRRATTLLGDGSGAFTTAPGFQPDPVPGGESLATADLDRDGVLDLVVTTTQQVLVAHGKGDGTFGDGTVVLSDPHALVGTAIADFDGDGRLDLAAAIFGIGTFQVALGKGDGTFQPATAHDVPRGLGSRCIVAADFDGDEKQDLALGHGSGILVYRGKGDGTFTLSANEATGDSVALQPLDFDGDGKLDLAAAEFDTGHLVLWRGTGDGTFTRAGTHPVGEWARALAAGDFDGDGAPDLAVAHDKGNAIVVFTHLAK